MSSSNKMEPVHGTRSRYRKGCRCYWCREAETVYRRRYRAGIRFWSRQELSTGSR